MCRYPADYCCPRSVRGIVAKRSRSPQELRTSASKATSRLPPYPCTPYGSARRMRWHMGRRVRTLDPLRPLRAAVAPRCGVVVAGDLNILYRYGEHGDANFTSRYATVFDRADALGLSFLGPQAPNGRRADPRPSELPPDSRCVPTFHHSRQSPLTATRQLDFVFASKPIAQLVRVRAINDPAEWGASDHCRLLIDVDL
jgi:endonuclease/exonuclease/phosphatase family metal-dependent hydrolase